MPLHHDGGFPERCSLPLALVATVGRNGIVVPKLGGENRIVVGVEFLYLRDRTVTYEDVACFLTHQLVASLADTVDDIVTIVHGPQCSDLPVNQV